MDMPHKMVEFENGERLKALIKRAKTFPPVKTAVVHPVEPVSLSGAVEAVKEGLIVPVLVGPRAKIESAAKEGGLDIAG